jgi:hypothetical protein
MYTIENVLEASDGVTKSKWSYRIGREVEPMLNIEEGLPLMLKYPSTGDWFSTSIIKDVVFESNYVRVTTANTIYVLKWHSQINR